MIDGRSYATPEPVDAEECAAIRERLLGHESLAELRTWNGRNRDTLRYHATGECAHDHDTPPLVETPAGWTERLTCDDCGEVFQSAGGLAQHEGTCVESGVTLSQDF